MLFLHLTVSLNLVSPIFSLKMVYTSQDINFHLGEVLNTISIKGSYLINQVIISRVTVRLRLGTTIIKIDIAMSVPRVKVVSSFLS